MSIFIYEVVFLFLLIPLSKKRIRAFNNISVEGKNVYLFFVFAILLVVSGFRAKNIGSDTLTYYHYFEVIAQTNSIKDAFAFDVTCPVYTTYEYFLTRLFSNPQTITFFNSFIICVFCKRLIVKSNSDVVLSTLLFIALTLHYVSMNGTRQFMAVAIISNGIYEIINNKNYKLGIVFIILALGIHVTSMISLVALAVFLLLKKNQCSFKGIYFGSIAIGLAISFGINVFINIFASRFSYYGGYLDGSMSANTFSRDGGGRIVFLYLLLLFFSLIYYFYESKKSNHEKNFLYFIIPYLNIGLMLGIVNAKNMLLNRMNWYFLIFYIVAIPHIFQYIKRRDRLFYYVILFVPLFVYCFLQLYENKSGIVPFVFCWE